MRFLKKEKKEKLLTAQNLTNLLKYLVCNSINLFENENLVLWRSLKK